MSKFLKVLVNSLLILAIVVAGGLLIPPFAGVTTVIVDDGTMDTNLSMGSVTYAVSLKEMPKEGNKVLVSESGSQYVYRVQSVNGDKCVLEDKLSTDGGTMEHTVSSTMKKVILTVPLIGYVSAALKTPEGLIVVGLSVVFIIVLFVLAEIWKKDDDDEEDEEDEEDGEDEAEEEEEDEPQLSRKERRALKKAEKKKKKAEKDQEIQEEVPLMKISETPVTEKEQIAREDQNLFEETGSILAADIAQMMGEESAQQKEETDLGMTQEFWKHEQESPAVEEAAAAQEMEQEDSIHLAIPSYTKEELINKAREAGDEPDVVEDEVSGITLLDYSDIL